MQSSRQPLIFITLALVWLALRIPHLTARFCFDWDSSQYARGVAEFNVAKHQPHPPGSPLWVLSARALSPLAGGPIRAQILLAFLITLLGLAVFYALARQILDSSTALVCTVLLAYSPGIALNGSISSVSMIDLVSSSVAGYLAFLDPRRRQWRIIACLVALAILAGFRQSGLGLLGPLVAVAALTHLRHAWRAVCIGAVLALLTFLAWYVPLAQSAGGWHVLSELTSKQFHETAQGSSIFFGAPGIRHLGMIASAGIYFAMNLCGWLIGLQAFRRRGKTVPDWWRYSLWMVPTLFMVFAIHVARVGQCLLIFPPLLLLCAQLSKIQLRAMVAGILMSLAISYFPYGRFQYSKLWPLNYIFYRSTPRMALDLEASQRNLDATLRALQPSAPQPFVCVRNLPEAPNIRTVTYDFAYLNWLTPEAAPRGRPIWLFDQNGPTPDLRQRYQNWRPLMGDELISLWEAAP